MFCSQCAHKLTPSDVYCPKCAKPIASFNFNPGQIPQVEYIADEELTSVRMPTRRSNPSRPWSWLAVGTLAGLAIAILSLGIVVTLSKQDRPSIQVVASPSPTPDQGAETRRAEQAARNAQVAINKAVATPAPAKTPIDIDAERAKIDERARRQRESNSVANAMNSANYNAGNTAYNVPWPPSFDSKGRRLRAICNSGTLSYWQGSKSFTCMAQGGVRVWYW